MVQLEDLVYKSYCWCFGTTSFRTKNFNRKIEEQLLLLKNFFDLPQNTTQTWENNNNLQEQYYLYMQEKGFVSGDAQRKDKDARQKTSGLVDLGLVDSNRKLTQAGISLLELSLSGNFASDNFLKIPKDSFIYPWVISFISHGSINYSAKGNSKVFLTGSTISVKCYSL